MVDRVANKLMFSVILDYTQAKSLSNLSNNSKREGAA
jgi:hypothetical protein